MRKVIFWLILFALVLTSCAPAQVATPAPSATIALTATPQPSATPAPTATPTPTPTATPEPTPTPITTLPPEQVGGLEGVPDPRISNPELFDLNHPDAPIPQFINAMRMGGIEVDPQQVADNFQYKPITGADGKQYIIGSYHLDPNPQQQGETLEGPIPLVIGEQKDNGKWEWREATRGDLGKIGGLTIGLGVEGWRALQDKKYTRVVIKDATHFQIDDLAMWSVLEPAEGVLSPEFEKIKFAFSLAQKNSKSLSAGSGIIWGYPDIIPSWIKNGRFTQEGLLSIAEDHLERFLSPFANNLQRVAVVNEILPHLLNIPNFWTETRGIDREILLKRVYRRARNVVPGAELALREYSVEFEGYPRSDEFFNLVKKLNEEEMRENGGKLIDAVEFQLPLLLPDLIGKDPAMNPNNFINPQKRSQMMEKLRNNFRRFREIGVNVYIAELFLPIDNLPGTREEKLALQAQIYADIYRVCAEEGIGITLYRPYSGTDEYMYPNPKKNTLPYPRDQNYHPLPSYYAINAAILQSLK